MIYAREHHWTVTTDAMKSLWILFSAGLQQDLVTCPTQAPVSPPSPLSALPLHLLPAFRSACPHFFFFFFFFLVFLFFLLLLLSHVIWCSNNPTDYFKKEKKKSIITTFAIIINLWSDERDILALNIYKRILKEVINGQSHTSNYSLIEYSFILYIQPTKI